MFKHLIKNLFWRSPSFALNDHNDDNVEGDHDHDICEGHQGHDNG